MRPRCAPSRSASLLRFRPLPRSCPLAHLARKSSPSNLPVAYSRQLPRARRPTSLSRQKATRRRDITMARRNLDAPKVVAATRSYTNSPRRTTPSKIEDETESSCKSNPSAGKMPVETVKATKFGAIIKESDRAVEEPTRDNGVALIPKGPFN